MLTGCSAAEADSDTATGAEAREADLLRKAIAVPGNPDAPLPEGQSGHTAAVQILLDRLHVSPGVIDGFNGGMTKSAIRALERRLELPVDGEPDADLWSALTGAAEAPLTVTYTITEADAEGLAEDLPNDFKQRAGRDGIPFTRVSERLAERAHMDEDFLLALNPNSAFRPGDRVLLVSPGAALEAEAARLLVDKKTGRLTVLDASGRQIADYPVSIGSEETPSPGGTVKVTAVAWDPTYSYNPDRNFQQGDNDEPLILPPGPNGPVGVVWIDLDKPTYGIHGAAEPSKLFVEHSHGCVRMTNWDALELSHMVSLGVVVEFVE